MADLDLLVDYVNHLQTGLEQADKLTREGELGKAVWVYLNVLEVDPDNAIARRQVGEVATAVRQFDATAPGRRWLSGFRLPGENRAGRWLWAVVGAILIVAAFLLGYGLASQSSGDQGPSNNPPPRLPAPPDNKLGQMHRVK
jgi:hypothetical protein